MLNELMNKHRGNFDIIPSTRVVPGKILVAFDPGFPHMDTIFMHPLDYFYDTDEDYLKAHEKAQAWIKGQIDISANQALKRIDEMYRDEADLRSFNFYLSTNLLNLHKAILNPLTRYPKDA